MQPLTLDQVHALTDTLASRVQLAQAMGWLEQFFDRLGDGYRLYHATFIEFLISSDTRAPRTAEFWVDATAEHQRLSRTLEGEGWPDAIWLDSPQLREQARRAYARLHYVKHLFIGGEFNRLTNVIEDGRYGRGKLGFDPSTFLYAQDLDLAVRAARRWEADTAVRPLHLLRLWQFKLLRATLSGYADRLPPAGYAALAVVGRASEAARLAELITDPEHSARASVSIGTIAAKDPNARQQAVTLCCAACGAAVRVADLNRRSALARDLLAAGLPAEESVRDAALALARSFPDATERSAALSSVALWLGGAGRMTEAGAIRNEIEALARATQGQQAVNAIYTCAMLAANLHDVAGARAAAAVLHPVNRAAVLAPLALNMQARGETSCVAELSEDLAAIRDAFPVGAQRARVDVHLAEVRSALGDVAGAAQSLSKALAVIAEGDVLQDVSGMRELATVARKSNLTEPFEAAVRALHSAAIAELNGSNREAGGGYKFRLRIIGAASDLARLGTLEAALEIARGLDYHERGDPLLSVVTALVAAKDFDRAIATAEEIVTAYKEGPGRMSLGAPGGYLPDDAAWVAIAAGLANEGQWERALEVAGRPSFTKPRIEAISRIAMHQHGAGLADNALRLIADVTRDVRLGDATSGRDRSLFMAGTLSLRARDWQNASSISHEIGDLWTRSNLQLRTVQALAMDGDLEDAARLCQHIESPGARAEGLLAIARKLAMLGGAPGFPPGTGGIIALLIQAREEAMRDSDKETCARVLRTIALAFRELKTGTADESTSTMLTAVETLNTAPRFQFRPSPWCDTAATFAKLGDWDRAMRIATGLVAHEAFDGCCAVCDLAAIAAKNGDFSRAAALLVQARQNAPRISFPPMRFDVLRRLAAEYARIGKLAEARSEDLLEGDRVTAIVAIGSALLESGQIDEALATIDELPKAELHASPSHLVDELLKAGKTEAARRISEAIADPKERAKRLAVVARHLAAVGDIEGARALVAAAGTLTRDAQFAKEGAWVLAETGDLTALDRFIEDRWGEARGRDELLDLIPVGEPLSARALNAGAVVRDAIRWVEATVRGT